jgi:hypothetical protein
MKATAKFSKTQCAVMAVAFGFGTMTASAVQPAARPNASAIANAPLYFEANGNQFVARGLDCNVALAPTEATLILSKVTGQSAKSRIAFNRENNHTETRLVRLQLVGANSQAKLAGLESLPGKANYLVGERNEWRTGVPLFAKVEADEIYPGIRVIYYANQSAQLEYDFILQARANPNQISFHIEGADKVQVDAAGNLVLKIGADEVRQHTPVIYQDVRGARKEIRGGYRVTGGATVGFWLGDYDHSLPLVIDPSLSFSTFLGGSKMEYGWAIALDTNNNVYVAGETLSKNLPVSNAAFPTFAGGTGGFGDAFIASYNTNGALRYLTYLGGKHDDGALGIAVDGNGNAYVAGFTDSKNFPITPDAVRNFISGRTNNALRIPPVDGFVAKLNPTGSQLLYSTFIGSGGRDECVGIALDAANNIYVTGLTEATNAFIPTPNGFQTHFGGAADAFVVKISNDGSVTNMTYLGGTNTEYGESISVDDSGNVWVTGFTASTNFPIVNNFPPLTNVVVASVVTTSNHMQFTNTVTYTNVTTFTNLNRQTNGTIRSDAFISRFSADLLQLDFSVYLGGSNDDVGLAITTSEGNAFVTGYTKSSDFPTNLVTASPSSALGFSTHVFVAKVNAGNNLIYSTQFGGSRTDVGNGIAADSSGNAYVTGSTSSTNFFASGSFIDLRVTNGVSKSKVTNDVFVAVLNPTGDSFVTNKNVLFGSRGNDEANDIAVNPAGDTAYIMGQTSSTDFPIVNAAQPILGNGKKPSKIADVFVSKILLVNPAE